MIVTNIAGHNSSGRNHRFRSGSLWVMSIIPALALNLLLFGLMPHLVRSPADRPHTVEKIGTVDFVRMKPRQTPPRPEPDDRQPDKQMDKARTSVAAPSPPREKFHFPAELNLRLPVSDIALPALPAMKSIRIPTPALPSFYDAAEIDDPLVPLVRTPPVYPLSARHRGIEGKVRVGFMVTENGTVEQIHVLEADPPEIFDRAVVDCVAAWRFRPGTISGEAVKVRAETIISFELE